MPCLLDENTSCATCCGMYNIIDTSRENVSALLDQRTDGFNAQCDKSNLLSLIEFRDARLVLEESLWRFELLRNCPFLGWLDAARRRPGCLLHPSRHGGVDYRDCGVYDHSTCKNYQCAPQKQLKKYEVELVQEACRGDSFLYGLVLHDEVFVYSFLCELKEQWGLTIDEETSTQPEIIAAFRQFLLLKVDWPFRDDGVPVVGEFLSDRVCVKVQCEIDYESLGVPQSMFDVILCQLGSFFDDAEELEEAESLIFGSLHDVVRALQSL